MSRKPILDDIAAMMPGTATMLCKQLYGGLSGSAEKNALYANICNMRKRGYTVHKRKRWSLELGCHEWEYYITDA